MPHVDASDALHRLLTVHGLEDYEALFRDNGFDDWEDLAQLKDADLSELGISKMGHRRKLLRVLSAVRESGVEEAIAAGSSAMSGSVRSVPPPLEPTRAADPPLTRHNSSPVPASPTIAIRTRPKHKYCGNRVMMECIAAKLEGARKDVQSCVCVSVCRSQGGDAIQLPHTVKRTQYQDGSNPQWKESLELPLQTCDPYYVVCQVRAKGGIMKSSKPLGQVAVPMKVFASFTDSTVLDNWFPLKDTEGSDEVKGELRLRLWVPGGAPSQIGKAFKVTGVKMDSRKLVVQVVAASVPESQKSGPRTTYVKLVLPNNVAIYGETRKQRRTSAPVWEEVFEFFAEVKNTPYLLAKVKVSKAVGNKTLGVLKLPLQFYLSLKERQVLDDWFSACDLEGVERAKLRLRLEVCSRGESEMGHVTYGQVASYHRPAPPLPPPSAVAAPSAGERAGSESEGGYSSDGSEAALRMRESRATCSCGAALVAADPAPEDAKCGGADCEGAEAGEPGWMSCGDCDTWYCGGCAHEPHETTLREGGCVMWPPPDGAMPEGLVLPSAPEAAAESPRPRSRSAPASPAGYPTSGPGPFVAASAAASSVPVAV
eukprot:TRINITY_DN33405_c0_g1_i1.p1 TRINITY_DN33405_c0_g1~~TRINITY_DN33405_c0_g1_i1.p1  ORF type:complete len:622 (+),score=70.98 TRINITY_DN33405_c0_g1_i1:77-1867(+)